MPRASACCTSASSPASDEAPKPMSGSSSPLLPSATRRRTRGASEGEGSAPPASGSSAGARPRARLRRRSSRRSSMAGPPDVLPAETSYRSALMDLELSDDQRELRDGVRRVLEEQCPPALARAVHERGETGAALWRQMVELAWPGIAIAEARGGLGLGPVELCLVGEELGRAGTVPGDGHTARAAAPGGRRHARRGAPVAPHRGGQPHRQRGGRRGGALGARRGRVPRAPRRRRLRAQRPQDGRLRRRHGRRDRGGGARRRGPRGVPRAVRRREGHAANAARPDARARGSGARRRRRARRARAARARTGGGARGRPRARGRDRGARALDGRHLPPDLRAHARVREAPPPVRAADRLLPGAEAPARGPLPRRRARHLARLLRGAHARRGRPAPRRGGGAREGRGGRLPAPARRRRAPAPRRHRLHLGARPAPLAEARQGRRRAARQRDRAARATGARARAGGRMRLSFDAGVEAFRREFLGWLAANRPSDAEMAADPARSSAHLPDWSRRWARRLFDAGWLVPGWPSELGGRNAGAVEQLVYLEELARANVPRTTNPQGLGIIAPSILDYG